MNRSLLLLRHVATLGPIGLIPFAPGSFGTAAACAVLYFTRPSPRLLIFLTVGILCLGMFASHAAEIHFRRKDPGEVVIDEFAGFFVSMIPFPPDGAHLVLAFLFFRFFDILKPPPIRWIERRVGGGAGVLLDDVLAGAYTIVAVFACRQLTDIL